MWIRLSRWLFPWMNAARFVFADDFLRHAMEHRVIYLAGRVGSGKSALAALLSFMLERGGLVDHTVSTMPLAWGVPAEHCPPRSFCAIFDEMGVEMDARSFADKKQNAARRSTLAYMRKLNIYAIVASRVSPDVSFRALTVQRVWSFVPVLPLEVYTYGFEDGKLETAGYFGVWNRAWLWSGRGHPSHMYGHEHIPDGMAPILRLIETAIEQGKADDEEPNRIDEDHAEAFCGWAGLEYRPAAYRLSRPENRPQPGDISRRGRQAQQDNGSVHIGVISEKNSAGGISFGI